jgi:hypothetical protein
MLISVQGPRNSPLLMEFKVIANNLQFVSRVSQLNSPHIVTMYWRNCSNLLYRDNVLIGIADSESFGLVGTDGKGMGRNT